MYKYLYTIIDQHHLDIIDQVEHGVHNRLHIYPLCGIFYFLWHRHQIEKYKAQPPLRLQHHRTVTWHEHDSGGVTWPNQSWRKMADAVGKLLAWETTPCD